MSYDFLLLPRDPERSWDQVLEANERLTLQESDRPPDPAARTKLERIADSLQAHDPQLERFTGKRHIELTRVDDTGIQVSLFSGELAVSVAYWHTGSAARAVMQIVWSYLAILEQETGWEVYDGQLGRSLDRARDLDKVSAGYAEMSAWLHTRFPGTLGHRDRWRMNVSGRAPVQQISTATSAPNTDLIRPTQAHDLHQRPASTCLPLVHTEEVTGSIPVSPTDVSPVQRLHGRLSS